MAQLHTVWATTLTGASVRYNHAVLRSAFRQAVEWRLVDRNPAHAVQPPRRVRRPMRAVSPAQARALLDAVRGDDLEALYVVAVTTGMRLGELLGLRWPDADLRDPARPRFVIQRTLAATALRTHGIRQKRIGIAAGQAWAHLDLVFADRRGEPLFGWHVTEQQLKPLLRRLGLPVIRFHDLRHTAATLLLMEGINPKVNSEMLGHSNVQLTLDTYTHVLPDMQAAAAMDVALG